MEEKQENWVEEPKPDLPVKLVVGDKWEGEDEEEDVKDNWDDDDEDKSESQGSEDKPKPPSMSKKKLLAQKIAEKEAKSRAPPRVLTAAEEISEKLERQRLQEESDLLLAKEAFGISENATGLDALPLSTKEDFEAFKKTLVARLQQVERSPNYVPFIEAAFRDICASMDPDDIKRLSSNLNTLWNEKVKAMKGPKAKKGKGKGGLKVERSAMDFDGGADYNDFDDTFM
jgi:translation initiation factor 3 subunit J